MESKRTEYLKDFRFQWTLKISKILIMKSQSITLIFRIFQNHFC